MRIMARSRGSDVTDFSAELINFLGDWCDRFGRTGLSLFDTLSQTIKALKQRLKSWRGGLIARRHTLCCRVGGGGGQMSPLAMELDRLGRFDP